MFRFGRIRFRDFFFSGDDVGLVCMFGIWSEGGIRWRHLIFLFSWRRLLTKRDRNGGKAGDQLEDDDVVERRIGTVECRGGLVYGDDLCGTLKIELVR